MPDFYVDDIEIEPYEYVRACSKSEIRELIIELVEEEHLPKSVLSQMKTDKNGKPKTSILEDEFLDKMEKLSQKFHCISKEHEEILETIFKKYI
jgi:hypothetical protein